MQPVVVHSYIAQASADTCASVRVGEVGVGHLGDLTGLDLCFDLRSGLEFIGANESLAFVVDENLMLRWRNARLGQSPLFFQLFNRWNSNCPVMLRTPSEVALVLQGHFSQPFGATRTQLAELRCECKIASLKSAAMLGNGSRSGEGSTLALVLLLPRDWRFDGVSPSELGLSRVEYELVLHLMDGKNVREAAEEMRISYHTARKYLQNIFAKTGVKRQTELVAEILQRLSQHD